MCMTCQNNRMVNLKRIFLDSLYTISDGGNSSYENGRPGREAACRSLSEKQLSFMTIGLYVASRGYLYFRKKRLLDDMASKSLTPSISPEDRGLDFERSCVYREAILRHGPYFIWASVCGSDEEQEWVEAVMAEGFDALNKYESGDQSGGKNQAGLQAFVMRCLCEKAGCVKELGWDEVMRHIHEEVRDTKDSGVAC
jgi:hypothetical protein